jgi:hypothetical protein
MNDLKPDPFITACAGCKKELRLLKDSTEGQRCYCGDCYSKLDEVVGKK